MKIAIFLVFSFAACIHLESQNLIDYDEKEYLQSLTKIEKKLRADWNKIKQQIAKAQTKLKNYENNGPEQVGVLQESLAQERDILTRIQEYMGLPFDFKSCNKNFNLTDLQRSNFLHQIEKIRDSIGRLRVNVNECGDCGRMVELRSQIERQEKILNNIQGIINSQCRKGPREFIEDIAMGLIDLGVSVPITNLNAKNWAYGNITTGQYKFTLFALSTKFNTSKCPINKPFARKRLQCIQCPQEKPLFLLSQQQCVACPKGTYFNEKRGNCTTGQKIVTKAARIFNNHPQALNFVGMRPLFDQKLETCPQDKPYTDGFECVVCNQPLIFNFQTQTCIKCPGSMTYNLNLHRCVTPQKQKRSNLEEVQNWVTNRTIQSILEQTTNRPVCPVDTPFYDGLRCIECLLPRAFNLDTLLCVTPTPPYVFNENLHKIVKKMDPPRNTRPDSQNLLLQPGTEAPKNTSNICPEQTPFWDGILCVSCRQPRPIFNYKSQLCTRCSNTKIFNQQTHTCQNVKMYYFTNLKARNILIPKNTTMEQIQKEMEEKRKQSVMPTEECPIDKPYVIKTFCDICPESLPIYNIRTNNCQACRKNTDFDENTHSCLTIKHVTNVQAPNIVQSKNQYAQLQEQVKSPPNNYKVVECPMSTPYSNGNQCIACLENKTLFSLQELKCTSCPDGYGYSAEQRLCTKLRFITAANATNLLYNGNISQYREEQKRQEKQQNYQQCSAETPYSIGQSCIQCQPPNRLFDLGNKKCTSCQNGLFYHPEKLRCTAEKIEVRSTLEKMLMNIG